MDDYSIAFNIKIIIVCIEFIMDIIKEIHVLK